MNSLPLFGAAGLCLGGAATYAMLRRRPSPDEEERKRRDLLVQQGRIIDATVIDISDLNAEESGRPNGMQLILYKYEAAGVVYECSQDVTMLRHLVNIYDCRLGFPASVRYDPHNPGNSLIVAEGWSGLRNTANSVPLHGRAKARLPRCANLRFTFSRYNIAMHVHGGGSEKTKRILRISLLATLAYVALTFFAGVRAHSLALISEAGHNVSDFLALLLSFVAVYFQTRPPT